MKIKERIYHTCPSCKRHNGIKQEEEYGCDVCTKPINREGEQRQYLQATVFCHSKESEHLEFCSWKCALKGLAKVKSDYFISLPFLRYDERQKGIRAQDFFAAIKRR